MSSGADDSDNMYEDLEVSFPPGYDDPEFDPYR